MERRPASVREGDAPAVEGLRRRLEALVTREAPEIRARFPKVLRRVGGYNLDHLLEPSPNLASILVGSEGTLAFFTELELPLQPLPPATALGICHFPRFRDAMQATPELVKLQPVAVELVD